MANREEYLLELEDISKSFRNVNANDGISLKLAKGEILALLGENGAGKSTLMNIIYGIYRPDNGKIFINGEEVRIDSPKEAMSFGIGMVHQHFMLIERFNAVENIILISEDRSFSLLNKKKVRERLEDLKTRYDIDVDLDRPVEQLSISMQQKVEILKLLYRGADILILDEPTAVLLPVEARSLFEIMRNMASQGKGVIFISHKMDEVLEISDRINVLSLGRVTGEVLTADADKNRLITMMSGEDALNVKAFEKKEAEDEVLLSCEGLEAYDDRKVRTLNGVDLKIHKGEIIGVAGVEGNGQEELAQVLAGVRYASKGRINTPNMDLSHRSTRRFMAERIGYIPSDRNSTGTVATFTLLQNWLLRKKDVTGKNGLLNMEKMDEECVEGMRRFDVRARDESVRSSTLSGGNLQKFILAREIGNDPKVLICSYPTRGLDVKAARYVHSCLIDARNNGTGILVISSDLEELFAISDRIVVLNRGKIVGEKRPSQTNTGEIVYMMMGGEA
ncbi:MAG: ABC transporter ATP-binding protein [Erysipelotrichaceae bacterium]|nr:ABC transporter ATP-binding protein [Erysipelotrichaceae bacterium]